MSQHERLHLDKQNPELYRTQSSVAKQAAAAMEEAGLSRELMEVINIRISQIHGCPFCLEIHTRRADELGAGSRKLALLPAWREAGIYTEQERAALSLAEMAAEKPAVENTQDYDDARAVLGDEATAAVLWMAVAISAFNTISIMSGHQVR